MNWVDTRREFHQIPELGFQEFETQKKIVEYLEKFQTEYMHIERWETGVLVHIEGNFPLEKRKKIGFRCDIDGLPIEEKVDISYRSKHPGKMHACGHDFHITFGLMLAEKMGKKQPGNNYLIVFQPAEEGPGGAQRLIKEKAGLFKELDYIFAFHIDPTMETGNIGYNEAHLFAGTQEINIQMYSEGGHAAYPEKAVDLTKVFSEMYLNVVQKKRNKEGIDRVIVHLGKVEIGEARNSFPTKIEVNGTIRSYDSEKFKEEIEYLNQELKSKEVLFEIERGPFYAPVINDSVKTKEVIGKLEKGISVERVGPQFTGEDFGFYGLVCPSVMCWIGAKSETGLHTDTLNPDERVLDTMEKIFDLMVE